MVWDNSLMGQSVNATDSYRRRKTLGGCCLSLSQIRGRIAVGEGAGQEFRCYVSYGATARQQVLQLSESFGYSFWTAKTAERSGWLRMKKFKILTF